MAVCGTLEVLTSVPFIVTSAPAEGEPPARLPEVAGAAQVYVVPAGIIPLVTSAGITVNMLPLHTVVDIAFIAGTGFTVTVRVKVAPVQPL